MNHAQSYRLAERKPRGNPKCSKPGHTKVTVGSDGYERCADCRRENNNAWRRNNSKHHRRNNDLRLFGGVREAVIQRDGEKCINCGMTREEHRKLFNKDITVNHIDGNGVGQARDLKNNDTANLETLCQPCHSTKDNLRRARLLASTDVADAPPTPPNPEGA